mgnify:CR=1 FL=1
MRFKELDVLLTHSFTNALLRRYNISICMLEFDDPNMTFGMYTIDVHEREV